MNNKTLQIFLTSYNEAETIQELIYECIEICKNLDYEFEIVVVDNCSIDKTIEKVLELTLIDSRISIISNKQNLGYSLSVFTAIKNSESACTIVMDGDGQYSPKYIPELISRIESGADLVLAERAYKVGGLWRRFGSLVFLEMCKVILNFNGPDINAGIRALSRSGRQNVVGAQTGRMANPNIWYQCNKAKLRIEFIKINPVERIGGQTTIPWIQPFQLSLESYKELIMIKKGKFDAIR